MTGTLVRPAVARAGDELYGVTWTALPEAGSTPDGSVRPITGVADLDGPAMDWLVLPVPGDDGTPEPQRVRSAVGDVLAVLQAFLNDPALGASRLVVTTRHAVSVDDTDLIDPVAAAVWGLVRSAQAEHPSRAAAGRHRRRPGVPR